MIRPTILATGRALLVLVAAVSLAAFTHKTKLYSIEFPQGWSAPVTDERGNAQSNAPGSDDLVWCRANSNVMPSLKDSTQAQLNKEYAAPLDQATWADVLSVDRAKITLIDGQARVVNGVIVQFATISFAHDVLGLEAKGRFASHIMPGRMVNAGCFAGTAAYAGVKDVLEKVVTSLKPL